MSNLGQAETYPSPAKTSRKGRDQENLLPHVNSPQRAYNAGAGGSNPSPPTIFVMSMVTHATRAEFFGHGPIESAGGAP
jgi:hypothetical protein